VVYGFQPASPVYTVTRADGRVVHEIDRESAVAWYQRFFTVDGLLTPMPESADGFPLVIAGPNPARRGLYRSLEAFDDPPGAVTLWSEVEVGDQVRLGISRGAGDEALAVRMAVTLAAESAPQAALFLASWGRQRWLGEAAAASEVAELFAALGGVALAGGVSFGEIAAAPGGNLGLHDHAALLLLLREKA